MLQFGSINLAFSRGCFEGYWNNPKTHLDQKLVDSYLGSLYDKK